MSYPNIAAMELGAIGAGLFAKLALFTTPVKIDGGGPATYV
jgi:hypothetical protein